MEIENWINYGKKHNLTLTSHYMQKLVQHRSQKPLNIKVKNMKLLEGNLKQCIFNYVLGKDFLGKKKVLCYKRSYGGLKKNESFLLIKRYH